MSEEASAPITPPTRPLSVQVTWRIRLAEYGPPALLVIGLLLLWEGLVWFWTVPVWLLPPPSRIVTTLLGSLPVLVEHILATLTVTIPGFALALVTGFGLGVALDASPLLRRALYPLLVTSQTVPIVAIAPLLVVGFGFGLLPKVLVVALITFFPIVVNTIDGLQSADRDQRRLLEAMGATYWQLLRLLRLRAALPMIFTGIKVAITYSVIGAVLAEWIGASAGLGVYIARSLRAFRTDQVFVAALVTSLLTIALFSLVSLLERWIVFWKGEH
ncbi:ABC transporter permease [Chloroflexus aggregans]|uniref:Binding-protein-dependent transport systems inner membrane component n=1 Tax=Chloroflexus aggregans (strain MD-66 / DSM 9485) TaxID=326427 RepID=B8G7D9_CHLAD|nr:ABC transporter permease [Chloroflexus aggregans]ACL25974.1 binding-protein-dependent transport systems inner membrane component [Chloroflexus aggregans DSM 9485]